MHFAMPLESELAALCQPLLRFAKLQLRNDAVAEDVVSETIIAILEKPANFEGRSSLRTYATGAFAGRLLLPLSAFLVIGAGFARATHVPARLKNFEVANSACMKGDVVITSVKPPHAR